VPYHLTFSISNEYLGMPQFARTRVLHVGVAPCGAWVVHASGARTRVAPDEAQAVMAKVAPFIRTCFDRYPPVIAGDNRQGC
jgi:hypothetical protein